MITKLWFPKKAGKYFLGKHRGVKFQSYLTLRTFASNSLVEAELTFSWDISIVLKEHYQVKIIFRHFHYLLFITPYLSLSKNSFFTIYHYLETCHRLENGEAGHICSWLRISIQQKTLGSLSQLYFLVLLHEHDIHTMFRLTALQRYKGTFIHFLKINTRV